MQKVTRDREMRVGDDRDESSLASWIAGIAAIGVAVAIALLGLAGEANEQLVLWIDAAIILSALVGLVAWIIAGLTRY